jgi:hypothetical protein
LNKKIPTWRLSAFDTGYSDVCGFLHFPEVNAQKLSTTVSSPVHRTSSGHDKTPGIVLIIPMLLLSACNKQTLAWSALIEVPALVACLPSETP